MGEIKSVKVDNWGVFFLQKLQNFFNKTDYCDLTLQFNDNSQLKVHRLVLSACTDYFNVLEQTCEMIDDVLIMPLELQADVVVPIVNFMYTGTLEFELRMYGKLLKTARDMNMTVLLKLLEAHRRTMERNPPHALNRMNQRNTYQRKAPSTTPNASSHNMQRRVQTPTSYKSLQIKPIISYYPSTSTTVQNVTKYSTSTKAVKGPSRFDYPEGKVLPPETFEQSFDTISYESKPLICKEEPDSEDYEHLIQKNSPFEELRRGYNNNKRPASSVSSFESPPEKKPNIEDVKEYAEQQRVRKQIAQEFEDDNEYEETLDDEFHHDDDDDDYIPPASYQKQVKQKVQQQKNTSKLQQQPIVIKQENDQPTIVVKDVPNTNMNHAKIISEVLRKYPHLVKNNKNIKLKILPKVSDGKSETQKIVVKKELDNSPVAVSQLPPPSVKHNTYPSASQRAATITAGTSLLQSKTSLKSILAPKSSGSSASTSATISQPRRIDSKTMHSLIAMGAENRTGPWLCLRCGINGRPISIPSYRGFRRHLINTHQEKIDARLCEHCGWRSTNNRELHHHMLAEHKIKPSTSYSFPKCELCDTVLLNYSDLEKHIAENHEEGIEVNQNCIYCNKTFVSESMLYAHMKSQHKERAREDGVIDFSEDDEMAFESDSQLSQYHSDTGSEQKIKILSDISIPKNIPIIQAVDNAPGTTITLPPDVLESSSSKLIDGSQGPRFVNADGKEMELTEEQRQEIISQLENQEHGAVVMVLNDDSDQLSSVLSGATASNSNSIKSVEKTTPIATVEKDLHKPRKTKHTVKTEDVEEGEEMIEWLDEESGNIMKVPLSKFSKMGELEEDEDEEGEEEAEGEEEEVDTETEKPSKEGEEEAESADEEKTKTEKDEKLPSKDKEESNDDKVKSAVESTKMKKKDEKDKTPEFEKKKDEEINDKKDKSSTKAKTEVSKAMETLKILTGDWTDEEEDEDVPSLVTKELESSTEHKTDESKDEEILFETKISKVVAKEENDTEKKSVDTKKQNSNDKENCEKDKPDIDMDLDDIVTTQRDETDILKAADDKLDDVIDDDMKIIEELKNYEQEQLAAAAKENDSSVEEKMQLRHKSKSKSASPAMSENSNSSHSNASGNSDKSKKRGRPRKTPSIVDDQKADSQDKDDDKVIADDGKEITDDKSKVQDDKSEKDDVADKDSNIIENQKISANENENSQSSNKIEPIDENEKKSSENEVEDGNDIGESEIVSEEQKLKSSVTTNPSSDNDGLITKAEIRNLISDWGDDDDDEDADL